MALKTVAQYKDSVAGLLSGIDLTNIDNLNGALERAARNLVQQADVPEACLTQNIVLYSNVYDYECDPRIFGTAINDLRPQGVSRLLSDSVTKEYGEDFDRSKGYISNGTRVTFEYVDGIPIVRIVSRLPTQRIILDPMTDTTGWVASGSASALTQDPTVFYQAPASLRFTLTGSSTGILEKTLPNTLDMSAYEDIGVVFLAIRIPDGATASNLTSITLRLGSDSSNYDTVTVTEGFLGTWVAGNWLLVAFNFASSTSTGTPDWNNIDYIQLRIAHTATMVNFRFGGLWDSLPTPAQLLAQSAAIFKAGVLPTSETIVNDDDVIILNNPAYSIYEYEGAMSILQQTGATEGTPMMDSFKAKLHGDGKDLGLYAIFRGDNPSQELRTVGSYYDSGGMPRGGGNGDYSGY